MARPFPPPLLMARPLREKFFFAASLTNKSQSMLKWTNDYNKSNPNME